MSTLTFATKGFCVFETATMGAGGAVGPAPQATVRAHTIASAIARIVLTKYTAFIYFLTGIEVQPEFVWPRTLERRSNSQMLHHAWGDGRHCSNLPGTDAPNRLCQFGKNNTPKG